MTKRELAAIETSTVPTDLIRVAFEKGYTPDQIKELLLIQERWESNNARKEYHVAMTAFKANPPKIKKDKSVAYGTTKYNHASLANVTESINAELSKHGLSASWTTHQNGAISVTCKITHVKGHSEETTLTAAADTSGAKNAIQAIGSAISYLQRYSLLALTGLATSEMDDDGNAAVMAFISEKQVGQLVDMIADKEVDIEKFCKWLNVESLDKIPASKFQQAFAALDGKKKVAK